MKTNNKNSASNTKPNVTMPVKGAKATPSPSTTGAATLNNPVQLKPVKNKK